MTELKKPNLPIGFWLKKVDQLLTEQTNEIQAKNGVSRLEWQTLNTLYETGGASQADMLSILATFTDADSLGDILSRFGELGWVDLATGESGKRYQLSNKGLLHHKVVLQAQQEARKLAMKDISAEDYSTVMRVLQQVAANLQGKTAESERVE